MTRKAQSVVALLLLVPAPAVGAWLGFLAVPGALGTAIYAFCKVWILLVPIGWLRFVQKRPFSLSPLRNGGLIAGAASGLAMSAAIVGAYLWVGRAWIDPEPFRQIAMHRGFGTLGKYALLGAYIIFCNSLLEEYVWRWFVFRRCEDLLAGWLAVLASGLFFTLHHAVLLAVEFDWKVATLSSAGVFAGGAIWSFHYLRYRSVWPGYLSHAIVDVTILAIGYHILFQ